MNRYLKCTVVVTLISVMLLITFSAGCAVGNGFTLGADNGLEVVSQAWNIIFQDYVEKSKLDAGKLAGGAIEGILNVLDDPYTAYLTPDEYELSTSGLEGKFEGIGATVNIKDEKITIVAPIDGSPAYNAGIKAGDVILTVDGTSTEGMTLTEAVLRIRGPAGTPVKLLVLHEGDTDPVEIEIIRDEIKLESVRYEMKEDIAYIRISHFSERTDEELAEALKAITGQNAAGIVLDLRDNPGGNLETVVNVTSQLIKEGTVLHVVSNQGQESTLSVTPAVTTDLPTVVLVNKYSASGSEVLSGALQDYHRATIAGTVTYGKGSVNVLRQLKDGSGLYITTARWLTPLGNLIEGKGVTPDVSLELEGDEAIQWAIDRLKGNK
jgi:carboxyl-terminal processing protease